MITGNNKLNTKIKNLGIKGRYNPSQISLAKHITNAEWVNEHVSVIYATQNVCDLLIMTHEELYNDN